MASDLLKDELPCLLPLPAVGTGPRPAPGARLSWDLPSPLGPSVVWATGTEVLLYQRLDLGRRLPDLPLP